MKETSIIKKLQEDQDYVILDNPFASPRFVKGLGKSEYTVAKTNIYSLKLFTELLSQINENILENTSELNQIKVEINIKDFLDQIDVEHNKGHHYVIETTHYLKKLIIQWTEDGIQKESVFISYSEHNPHTGRISIFMPQQFAKRVLKVGMKENFSYLKKHLFKLSNGQAIKLYPFFKSWASKGKYTTYEKGNKSGLQIFKEQFGFNSNGYTRFANFENKVLKPSITEINEKTDITVEYEITGSNLESVRPRVKGLIFYIKTKDRPVELLKIKDVQEKQEDSFNLDRSQAHRPLAPKILETPTLQVQVYETKQEADAPTMEMIRCLGQKLKLEEELLEIITSHLEKNHVRVWEVLQGCLNEISNGKSIKSPFAYMIVKNSLQTLGLGLWRKNLTVSKAKVTAKSNANHKYLLEDIQLEYRKVHRIEFEKIYNELTLTQRNEILQTLWDSVTIKKIYFTNNDIKQPNFAAVNKIGEIFYFPEDYNYNIDLKIFALKHFNVAIDLKKDGTWIVV